MANIQNLAAVSHAPRSWLNTPVNIQSIRDGRPTQSDVLAGVVIDIEQTCHVRHTGGLPRR